MKQWESKHLGCNYTFLDDSSNRILTSDGILLDYSVYKNLGKSQYDALKASKSRYDYQETLRTGKLSITNKEKESPQEVSPMAKKVINDKSQIQPKKPIPQPVIKAPEVKEIKTEIPVEKIEKPVAIPIMKKKKINLVNIAERLIMLAISCMTIILSIYYTRAYLLKTNSNFISTLLSVSMLLYSLIGLQLVTVFKKKKRYIRVFLFFITSIMTIAFSMFTSLDINVSKYLENTKVVKEEQARTDVSVLILQNIREQKEQNRNMADKLKQDMDYYASRQLNTYTQREDLKVLDQKYEELSQREIEILSGNTQVSESLQENSQKEATSLVEIIGNAVSMDSNLLQMLIMCFASIFIDVLAPLALNIAIYGKEDDEENT